MKFVPESKDRRFISLSGRTFGRLTVLGYAGQYRMRSGKPVGHLWWCKCACGTIKKFHGSNLRKGLTKSCGCSWRDFIPHNKTHGESHKSPEYATWVDMMTRCRNKNRPVWPKYGGRGIKVTRRWNKFENFLADMGRKADGLTLDRINNNGNYCKSNCRWATRKEQARNRRSNWNYTHKGETMCMADWADRFGIGHRLLRTRMKRGIPFEIAVLSVPRLSHNFES